MPLFTAANAREMGAKSHEARRQRSFMPAIYQTAQPQSANNYVTARLVRVREQLNRIDSMMSKETDPQKLDRLALAQARVAEQERILDGRPLPGSRKPSPERPGGRYLNLGPVPEPVPAAPGFCSIPNTRD